MLARLWWKEWRTLAPIAGVLAGSAVVVQWFLLYYGGREVREGILATLGFGWAMLYAFVAGTSSFAGERENRTMGLLDALPVDRRTLWLGKATFALASSMMLAAALMLLGLAGSESLGPGRPVRWGDLTFGAFVLVWAVALGLFWSAYCRSAIAAGILAVVATILVPASIERWLEIHPTIHLSYQNFGPGPTSAPAVLTHLALISVVLGASWWVVVHEVAPRSPWRRSFALAARPIRLRPAILDRGPGLRILPSAAFGRVLWQTVREGRATWLGMLILTLVAPTLDLMGGDVGLDPAIAFGLVLLATLIQGASVFGLENAAGTRQYLDNVAVSPRTVWAAKVFAWGLGLAAFAAILLGVSLLTSQVTGRGPLLHGGPRGEFEAVFLVAGAANALAAGVVAGMALTRRITAVLVATLAAFAIAIPQFSVVGARLAPIWGLAIVPTALVAATFFWAGDWLAVRPGWRRWARLAGLIGGPIAATGLLYVGGRAWGLPDVGPQFDAAASQGPTDLAVDYRRMARALAEDGSPFVAADGMPLVPRVDVIDVIGPIGSRALRDHLAANAANLAEVRRLAAGPGRAWFGPARSLLDDRGFARTQDFDEWSRLLRALLWHLAQEAADRRARGDLAGAWDDILAQARLADQFARGARSVGQYGYAMVQSGWAPQALEWASDRRTPLAAIRGARAALESLGEPAGIAEAVRVGSARVEQALDRSTDEWVEYLNPPAESGQATPWNRISHSWLIVPSWERERARRVLRSAAAAALRDADRAPSRRTGIADWARSLGGESALQTPLAQMLFGEVFGAESDRDLELTNRRALVTFLALRAWQLTHDGVASATLDQIVPAELAAIPVDPYSRNGSPFGYGPVERPPGYRDAHGVTTDPPGPLPPPFSTYVLCSVGSDGGTYVSWSDGSARGFREGAPAGERWNPSTDDLTYPLPPNPAGAEPPTLPAGPPGRPADAAGEPPPGL